MTPSSPPFRRPHLSTNLAALLVVLAVGSEPSHGLERIPYRNPGLTVDLGVGLWSAPIPHDVDGDGDLDLVVVCHDKPYQGTYLFENPAGRGVKFPVFKAARRLGRGIENAMPSYGNPGLTVLTPGRSYPDFLRTGMDRPVPRPVPATVHTNLAGRQRNAKGVFRLRESHWRYADFDGDGALDLIHGIADWSDYGWDDAYDARGNWTNGPLHGFVYLVRNRGTTASPDYEAPRPVQAGGRPIDGYGRVSPNLEDFDGDGDLDLLCGEFLDGFTYYENRGTRAQPDYAPGRRVRRPDGSSLAMDLEMISPVVIDWDGDGDLDLVVGDEDGRVALVENPGGLSPDHTPHFLAPRYFQQEAGDVKCGALATPVAVDWDGDGDLDLLSGNTAGYIEFFENLSGPRVESPRWAAPYRLAAGGRTFRIMAGTNGSIQGPAEAKWGYTTFNVADWDADGRPDILFNSILGNVEWLRNTGTRTRPELAAPRPVEVEWTGSPPALAWGWRRPEGRALLTQWRTTPLAHDFNADGLPDLAMLDHEGYLAFFERFRGTDGMLRLRAPRRAFLDERGQPLRLTAKRAGGSGRRKLAVVDWDGDGRTDLLLNSANANFLRQTSATNGTWTFSDRGALAPRNIEGHDVSPAVTDWNGDGIPDFVGGAEDGHFYYLRNPRTR